MKKIAMRLAIACVALAGLSSCAVMNTQAGMGWAYTDVQEPAAVTSNARGSKVGTSEATNILGLVAMGDASVQTAARNAGITKISHVDYKKTSVIGVYAKVITVVYGE